VCLCLLVRVRVCVSVCLYVCMHDCMYECYTWDRAVCIYVHWCKCVCACLCVRAGECGVVYLGVCLFVFVSYSCICVVCVLGLFEHFCVCQ
jgi:hypothetical protein